MCESCAQIPRFTIDSAVSASQLLDLGEPFDVSIWPLRELLRSVDARRGGVAFGTQLLKMTQQSNRGKANEEHCCSKSQWAVGAHSPGVEQVVSPGL